MATLSNLVVRISGNTTKLNTALTSAETRTGKFKRGILKAFTAIKVASLALGIGLIAAFGSFVVSIGKGVQGLVETEAALRPMVQRSRIAAESLQVLAEAAKRAGSEDGLEGVVDSAQELQLQLGELFLTGSARAEAALLSLGLVAAELQTQTPEAAFRAVLFELQQIPNVANRAIAAEEIFGGTSEKLAGIINLTTAEFAALEKEVIATSDIWSGEALESAKAFDLELQHLKTDLGRGTNALVLELLPALTNVMTFLRETGIPAWQEFKENALSPLWTFIKDKVIPIVIAIKDGFIGFATEALAPVIAHVRDHLLPIIRSLWSAFKEDLWPVLRDDIIPVFLEFKSRALEAVALVLTTVVIPALTAFFEFIRDNVVPIVRDQIIPAITDLADAILPKIKTAWDDIVKPALLALVETIKTLVIPIINLFTGAIDTLTTYFNTFSTV